LSVAWQKRKLRPIGFLFMLPLLPALILQGCAGTSSTVDTTPPTAPTGLSATATSATQINLSWGASTAHLGVTGYRVERCSGTNCSSFVQIASPSGTTYSDTGLTASTSYTYRVRATDAAGNLSAYSNTASATTQAGPDTTPPTAPTNLVATGVSSTQVNLTWTASTDNVGVTGYRVERCTGVACTTFAQIGTTTTATAYSDTTVTVATPYSYRVRATDAAANLSPYSNTASTIPPDTAAPTPPTGLAATAVSPTEIDLSWTASTDNVGVTQYVVQRCSGSGCSSFVAIGTTAGTTSFQDKSVAANTPYTYKVAAKDGAGNVSAFSNVSSATTPTAADTTPPTAPTNLTATGISSTQINLAWTASTDNVGVTGYRVERCTGAGCSSFAQIGSTTTATTYSDTTAVVATSYSYRVRATDAAGNLSTYSNTATATAPDTTPPTAPTNLAATASSSSQIGVTWTASTDNVGVTGYRIERCTGASCSSFGQIATPTATSYNDTGLTASTSYSYRVRATDAAGNLSIYSNTASAATSGSSITVSVSPARGGLTLSQKLTVTATLTNDTTNAGVSWSSIGGGSFSAPNSTTGQAVTFIAPSSPGVLTIKATSLADGSKIATATIGVTDLTGVTTYLNGNSRQGGNLQEYALATSGPTAVNSTNFGKLFSCPVDGAIYAQPLWVANLTISGAKHNVVYVATQHDTLYAFDADTKPCFTLWQTGANSVNSLLPSGQTWVTSSDTGCGDLVPDVGIVGTPAIDLATNTIYVVSKSKTSSGTTTYHQLLHALDITTGGEKFSGPTEISASVSGTGSGSSGGIVKFDPLMNGQRPALTLENGHIIIAWASHCDFGPYHGWIMSYSASALSQEAVLNVSPNGINDGIWMSGNGPAADSTGNIYFATGNGTFDVTDTTGFTNDYGDTIIKLGPPSATSFSSLDYFRSYQQEPSPDSADIDQGSGGVLLLPAVGTKNYLIQAGKDGHIYIMNQTSLGGSLSSTNNVIQEVSTQFTGGIWGSPTYWNGNIYFGAGVNPAANTDPLRAFSFDAVTSGTMSGTPTSSTSYKYGFPGPTSPISSGGTTNGITWALDNQAYCTSQSVSCGPSVLHVYDATNLATELWNSTQGSGNTAGNAVKFAVPTIANGKVYVGTRGNNTGGSASSTTIPGELDVFGLLP
jgi:fibronectin type 3 domain-containing protein